MGALGPFEPAPTLAVGVSGGADSMALAWLADRWARGRGGRIVALIVDHGLRAAAAVEARRTADDLAGHGIEAEILRLENLAPGPDLAARAREGRYAVLEAACVRRGVLHLLVAHHAGDQAETVAMRMLAGSDGDGLAGMALLAARRGVSLLRPLLGVAPGRLRRLLIDIGWQWVEDPSNHDPRWQRARVRGLRHDRDGRGPATRALVAAAARRGRDRARRAVAVADELARRVAFFPEGFAILAPGPISVPALRSVLRVIAGARYAPSAGRLAGLAASPRPCTIGGVRLLPAGRLGPQGAFLLVRERPRDGRHPTAAAIWPGLPFAVRRTLPPAGTPVFGATTPAT